MALSNKNHGQDVVLLDILITMACKYGNMVNTFSLKTSRRTKCKPRCPHGKKIEAQENCCSCLKYKIGIFIKILAP